LTNATARISSPAYLIADAVEGARQALQLVQVELAIAE
jgi:hypothetical protein